MKSLSKERDAMPAFQLTTRPISMRPSEPADRNDDYFVLDDSVGRESTNDRLDVVKAQTLLGHAGYFDMTRTEGPTGWYGKPLELGIRNYQRDRGLAVDGFMQPGGETISALQDEFGPIFASYRAPTLAQIDEHHERRARGEAGVLEIEQGKGIPLGVSLMTSQVNAPSGKGVWRDSDNEDARAKAEDIQLASVETATAGGVTAVPKQTGIQTPFGRRGKLVYGLGKALADFPEDAREAIDRKFTREALAEGIGSVFDEPLERRESANTRKSTNIMMKECEEILRTEIRPLGFNFQHFAGGSQNGDGIDEVGEKAVKDGEIGKGGGGHNFPDLLYRDEKNNLYVGFNIATESGPGKYVTREIGSFLGLVKNMGEWVAKITGKKRNGESDEDFAKRVREVCKEGFRESVKDRIAKLESMEPLQQPTPSDLLPSP